MTCDFQSLLPRSTEAMLALEQEANEKYCRADPEIIKQLHDPELCPIEFLPWLAYALSVDVWNDGWPEATKRAVCANAREVHKHKGLAGGIEMALYALGVRLEIVEWWQTEPKGEPGTLDLTLWVNDNIMPHAEILIGAELTRDLLSVIDSSKRASLHYKFTLGIEMHTGFQVGYSTENAKALTRVDALHTQLKTKASTGFKSGYSVETARALTRVDALHTQLKTKASTGFKLGFSAGESVALTHMEMTI